MAISQIAREEEIPILVVLLPIWRELNGNYEFSEIHDLLDKAIADEGLYSINMAPGAENVYEEALEYLINPRVDPKDYDHPNYKGHRRIADMIYEKLVQEKLLPQ